MEAASVQVDEVIDDVLKAEEDDPEADEDVQAVEVQPEIEEADACGPLGGFSVEQLTEQVEEDPTGASSFVSVSRLGGAELFYARGLPEPRPTTFSIEARFRDVVLKTIKSVRARTPESFGELVSITSAGVFVAGAGKHGEGRAFDHDAWTFEHVDIRPFRHDHVADSRARRLRYWALAAIIRSHSSFVLHGHYNADHEDHIHQDNSGSRPFSTGSESTVKLAQAVCKHIYGESLGIDGDFGEDSDRAVRRAMIKAGLAGDVFDPEQWNRFLRRSGRLGFVLSAQD